MTIHTYVLISTQISKNANMVSTRVYGMFSDPAEAESAQLELADKEAKHWPNRSHLYGREILSGKNGREIIEVCHHVNHKA